MLLLGGIIETRQISLVENCQLKRTGSLPFDHVTGTCTVLNEHVYLCFGQGNENICFYSDDLISF